MKFDTLEKDATSIGDISNNNVSIDTSNIDFIVTILSTSLYSKPIDSFLREAISNAWDSHTEAGVSDPVVLELGKNTENKYFCKIQDFGVGLSPERFETIYKNIGSSTKRADNQSIGGFGIGRFAALSYADTVQITSNYDGLEYKYLMYKDGNSISIDLLNTQKTINRNGLEIFVYLKDNHNEVNNFRTAIKNQLCYFENLYIIDNTHCHYNYTNILFQDDFNDLKIKKFNNFSVNTLNESTITLLLGKVLYPLRQTAISDKYVNYIFDYPISLPFEIGELSVTPNREEVLYNTKNVQLIEERLDKALEEIEVLINSEANKDYTSLSEYVDALNDKFSLELFENITINNNDIVRNITLNNIKYDKKDFLRHYKTLFNAKLLQSNYNLQNDRFIYNNNNHNIKDVKVDFHKFYNCDIALLNIYSKQYIRENFSNCYFINNKKSFNYWYRLYRNYYLNNYNNGSKNELNYKIFKLLILSFVKNLNKMQTFNNDKVPQSYIDNLKLLKKQSLLNRKNANTNWSENIVIYKHAINSYNRVVVESQTVSFVDIKKYYKKLTVYAEKGNTKIRCLFQLMQNNKRISFLEVAPTKMKLLKSFDNFLTIDEFMNTKYKLIRQIGTAVLIDKELPDLYKLYKLENLKDISTKLAESVNILYKYKESYLNIKSDLTEEIYNLCIDNNYFDEEVKSILNTNIDMIKKSMFITYFLADKYSYSIPNTSINFITDYILSRKLFRPNLEAVEKLKKETIYNLKQEENEIN
jgi:hypothetical protein